MGRFDLIEVITQDGLTVYGLFEWKKIFAGFLSFVSIFIAVGDPIIKRERIGFLLICLSLPHFVPVPSQDLDFKRHAS